MTDTRAVEHNRIKCQSSHFGVGYSNRAALWAYGPVKWRFRNDSKGFCLMLQINNKPQGQGVIIYFAK